MDAKSHLGRAEGLAKCGQGAYRKGWLDGGSGGGAQLQEITTEIVALAGVILDLEIQETAVPLE